MIAGLWAAFVGAVVEAWAELRIHKTQVLLSLIGVGVAVAALTGVVAAGSIGTQATVENFERQSGRPASIGMYAYNPMTGEQPSKADLDVAFATAMERYGVTYVNRTMWGGFRVQFPDGVLDIPGVLKALKEVKFKGMIAIEYEHNPNDPSPDVKKCVEYVREAGKKLG